MVDADTSSGESMDDWLTPTSIEQDGNQFDAVVLELRKQARVDETQALATASVALTLREALESSVTVDRPRAAGEPDVLVDESIGVAVLEDDSDDENLIFEVMDEEEPADPDEIDLDLEDTSGIDHLVVYANEALDVDEETWERLQLEYTASTLGVSTVSFVGGPTGSAF